VNAKKTFPAGSPAREGSKEYKKG
jgi:hypothetical protein